MRGVARRRGCHARERNDRGGSRQYRERGHGNPNVLTDIAEIEQVTETQHGGTSDLGGQGLIGLADRRHRQDLGGRFGLTEVVALRFGAAEQGQLFELLQRFHTLRDGAHPKGSG